MQLFKYICRNMMRNKIQSLLTILSVGFSLAMMTVLYGFMASQDVWADDAAGENRIVVMSTQGFSGRLPISCVDEVRGVDGVAAAVPYTWFGGKYKDEEMPFNQFATDAEQAFDVFSQHTISAEELTAWKENRRGCVIDRRIAEKRNWKIGERIPLQGTYYPFDLELELCGMYDSPKNTDSLWFHWQYLDEGMKQKAPVAAGNAAMIYARVQDRSGIPAAINKIDDRYASSTDPTLTQTEAAFAQMFAEMMGDIQTLIRNIGLAVVLSLSLVAASSMAMSVRERVTEIAVLKAIGFPRLRIMLLILGESCLVAFLGGVLGVGLGCGLLQMMNTAMPQFFPFPVLDYLGAWLAYGLILAAVIGVISGVIPAIGASRLSVIDGLRRVA